MKIRKLIIIFFTITAIVIVLLYEWLKPHYHTPKLNPHPQYFLTIEGSIAPEFRGVGHLVFIATYSASKALCFHETNVLAGMSQAESRTQYYWVKPDKSNHYKIKIPIDKYHYGVCGWVPYTIAKDFVNNKNNVLEYAFISIAKQGTEKYNPAEITYICNKPELNSCIVTIKNDKNPVFVIRPNQSYQVIVNIQYQKIIHRKSYVYN